MGVGEADALLREAVHLGGGDLALGVEGAHIAVAEVVAEDIDDVGFGGGASSRGGGRGGEGEKEGEGEGAEGGGKVHGASVSGGEETGGEEGALFFLGRSHGFFAGGDGGLLEAVEVGAELADFFGVGGGEVVFFAEVMGEVVEFNLVGAFFSAGPEE